MPEKREKPKNLQIGFDIYTGEALIFLTFLDKLEHNCLDFFYVKFDVH